MMELKYKAQLLAAKLGALRFAGLHQVHAQHFVGAAARVHQRAQDGQQCALARTGRATQRGHFGRRHRKVDTLEN